MAMDYQQFAQALAAAMAANRPPRHEKIAETALKGMGHQPKYKAKTNFRQFEVSYRVWRGNVGLDTTDDNGIGIVPADIQATFLVNAFTEEPALRIATIARGTVPWNQTILDANEPNPSTRFENFFARVRRLFLPEGESRMAKVSFKNYKQKADQNMSAYVTNKIALWEDAYTDARANHFQVLLDETIAGVGNMVIKRELRRSVLNTPEELRDRAINLVAIERQCLEDGSSESSTYDFLTPVTADTVVYGDIMMDDSMNKFGDKDACHRCGKLNHRAADCRTPWTEIRRPPKQGKPGGTPPRNNNKGGKPPPKSKFPPNNPAHKNLTCDHCQIRGHIERDCRKKKAGEPRKAKKPGNNGGNQNRGNVRTMDGSDQPEDIAEATEAFLEEAGETH